MHISLFLFIVVLVLIFFSAFLSASETAFFSLDEMKIRLFKQHHIKMIRMLSSSSTLLLASILIANTFVNVLLTTVLETLFKTLDWSFNLGISTVLVSIVIILFGEILPKSFATTNSLIVIPNILLSLSFLVKFLSCLATPINRLTEQLTSYFSHYLSESESKEDRRIALYNIVARGQFLKNEEKILIGRVLSLADRKVTAVMTPRPRVFLIEEKTSLADLYQELLEEQHSKIPVYREQDSCVVGVICFEDIAIPVKVENNLSDSVSNYIKPIYFIPESKTLGSLLEDFREKHIYMAAVVDEYGDFLGIITLSDIMAELVGEVVDEDFENDIDIIEQLPKRFIVRGDVSLIDFNDRFHTALLSEQYETIAGFLIEEFGGIPPLYYTFENGNIVISVRKRSTTRIESLSVRIKR